METNNKKLHLEDFRQLDYPNDDIDFDTTAMLWGQKVRVTVALPEESDKNTLGEHLDTVNEFFAWVEENRTFIENGILKTDCIEELEDMIKYEYETSDSKTYTTRMGEKIILPISRPQLKKSLSLSDFVIFFRDGNGTDFQDFEASFEEPNVGLCLEARPFTNGAVLIFEIEKKKKINFTGLIL